MNYGRAIKIVRATKNFSQQELAEKTKLDKSYISLIESEKRQPSKQAISKFALALDVPEDLISLLAAEKKDLRNIEDEEAHKIGKQLIHVLLSSELNS